MFICSKRSDALKLGVSLNTAWVEFPRPNKIDRFVHTDSDRKTEFLSLSLQYNYLSLLDEIRDTLCRNLPELFCEPKLFIPGSTAKLNKLEVKENMSK